MNNNARFLKNKKQNVRYGFINVFSRMMDPLFPTSNDFWAQVTTSQLGVQPSFVKLLYSFPMFNGIHELIM